MDGGSQVFGQAILEVPPVKTNLIAALFIVGFFEWGLVYFTNWPKQVRIAYDRYCGSIPAELIL